MGAFRLVSAPPPGLVPGAGAPVPNAYFAVRIDAAVDLLEAREYQGLSRADRLAKALGEQQGFLNGFSDPALNAALDLRISVDPGAFGAGVGGVARAGVGPGSRRGHRPGRAAEHPGARRAAAARHRDARPG